MYAKVQISGVIEVKTGMHIGGSSAFAAIGAVDAPVIRDVRTNLPMIPGSSLKGKMRTLLAKEYNTSQARRPDEDAPCLTRLFGAGKTRENYPKRSRVLFADMFMINEEELRRQGLQSITEIKFENTINRATAVANPRQIERAVRGSKFKLDIMYEVENPEEMEEDFKILAEGMKLLQYDYLGGSGSRGYGKIAFRDLAAAVVVGKTDETVLAACNAMLAEVSGRR